MNVRPFLTSECTIAARIGEIALAIGMVLFSSLAVAPAHASAKAPPLATAVFDATVYAAPELNASPLGTLPAGSEVELTGDAAPGYLAIYYGNDVGWVPSQYLASGVRPGIDTAVAIVDTPLLDAPMHDAGVIEVVPEGDAVILTGASVDGYDAASHEGSGGWLDRRDIAR